MVYYFNSHILLVMKNKMAECFAKLNHEQEIRYFLDIKQQEKANSLAMSSYYTTRAHGIIVKYLNPQTFYI